MASLPVRARTVPALAVSRVTRALEPPRVALVFALGAMRRVARVSARRSVVGPRHAGWSWTTELVAQTLRDEARRALRSTPEELRARVGTAPLVGPLRRRVDVRTVRVGPRSAEQVTPSGWTPSEPTLLFFHGGGYVFGSPGTHRDMMARVAIASGARCLGLDYRLAPEHPFPAAIDDCVAGYRALLAAGVPPGRLLVGGDSAGGALALSTLIDLRDAREPMPAGALVLSPWVDLECAGRTVEDNQRYDYLTPEVLRHFARLYLGGADPRHPLASPLHADLSGLPPLLIQVGGAEGLRSEVEELAARAEAVGVDVTLEVWGGMPHAFQGFAALLPDGQRALEAAGGFAREVTGRPR